MALNTRIKNSLILSIVATVILIPALILSRYIFQSQLLCVPNGIIWAIISATAVIYFILIFLVFLYYGSLGRK